MRFQSENAVFKFLWRNVDGSKLGGLADVPQMSTLIHVFKNFWNVLLTADLVLGFLYETWNVLDLNCGNTDEMKMWSSQLQSQPVDLHRSVGRAVQCYNAETTSSNPVEAQKLFFGLTFQLLKLGLKLRWSHLHLIYIPAVQINFIARLIPVTR